VAREELAARVSVGLPCVRRFGLTPGENVAGSEGCLARAPSTCTEPRGRGQVQEVREGYFTAVPRRASVPHVVGLSNLRVATLETIDCWAAFPARSLSEKESAKP
jgi:hypothetical protein